MNRWLQRLGDRHIRHVWRHGRDRLITGLAQLQWRLEHRQQIRWRGRSLPLWVYGSLALNILMVVLAWQLFSWQQRITRALALMQVQPAALHSVSSDFSAELGPRHTLTYEQWVSLLAKEAQVAAQQQPPLLTILLGDSISQWFPPSLLEADRTWLNQGISGETSTGLLRRLELIDATQPDTILVMIGINDLLRGESDEVILSNYDQIVQYLRAGHPNAQIVVQSILPHSGAAATWEGRDRLLNLPNNRIVSLNTQIAAIAQSYGADYLDLYPLFADNQGYLPMALSTDGLHLNQQGYLVWRSALRLYWSQIAEAKG